MAINANDALLIQASHEYKIQELTLKFKHESPVEFDGLVDCTLCSAFCYIQMR